MGETEQQKTPLEKWRDEHEWAIGVPISNFILATLAGPLLTWDVVYEKTSFIVLIMVSLVVVAMEVVTFILSTRGGNSVARIIVLPLSWLLHLTIGWLGWHVYVTTKTGLSIAFTWMFMSTFAMIYVVLALHPYIDSEEETA